MHDEDASRYRLLVESVRDYAVFILGPTGVVETWNAGAERIKGYRGDEIIGKHFSTFYPEADVTAGKCELELKVAAAEGRFEDEGWRIRKDGSRFWANVTITALRSPTQALVGFAKVTRDLTDRRRAEQDTMRFRLLVESVKDYAIFMLDSTGRVETWNIGAERIKGYAASEIIGKHFSVFYPPEVAATDKLAVELDVARKEGRFEEEGWRVRKDGSRFWASVTITAVRDESGAVIGFAKVTRDLTERRRSEDAARELAARTAALEEKSRVHEFQERFIAILGHDLRNPLSAIDMGTALLTQAFEADPATVRILDRMRSSSRRMSRMIEQILDLTRSRLSGGIEVQHAPIELAALLSAIVDELLIANPGRRIALRCPPLHGAWDKDRLEQVFSNLIGNALHHGAPDQPVTVTGEAVDGTVSVRVHNHGRAIPDALRTNIFNPFRRGDRESRTTNTAGLGLGLYISREITRAHGGDIAVRSSEAEGTTFEVTLPIDPQVRRQAR